MVTGKHASVVRMAQFCTVRVSPHAGNKGTHVLCSAIDITRSKIVDEEIITTLNELEHQVKERTADLERMNEKLRAEILECRRFESTVLYRTSPAAKKGGYMIAPVSSIRHPVFLDNA